MANSEKGNQAMRTRKKPPEKKRAAASMTAPTIKLHQIAYRQTKSLSKTKIIIGGLLLFGDKNEQAFWPFFSAILRQYIDLKMSEDIR